MATRKFHSTPPKPTARGYIQYSAKPAPPAKERKEQLRKNMQRYYLGPMDPTQFISSFMPMNSQDSGDTSDDIDFSEVYKQTNKRSMYDPFITIANSVCTNYVVKFTGDRADHEASLKPDITLFLKNDVPDLPEGPDTTLLLKDDKSELRKASTEASFLHMELFVELKQDTQSDPFRDLPEGGMQERCSTSGNNTRGQCLLYAANQLAYQHRLFAFSLAICGKRARFIRWDREGAVVSSGIDCSQRPELVTEFLRRFNQLTPEQRGLDPTAVPATPEQTEMFESAVAEISIESLRLSVGDRDIYPRYRLEVRDSDNTLSHYIVGKALDYNLGIVGRCTRGHLALDLSTKECVFIKDMWRPDVPGIEPEHVWYEKLFKAKVPYLVKFKHASDIVPSTPPHHYYGTETLRPRETTSLQGAQRGLTHRLACLFNSQLQGHVHYRLVQAELCRPLSDFSNSKHLVLVLLHSLKSCSAAVLDAGLFHRDASLGNIMIGLDDEGRLNDWDLCRGVDIDKSLEGPRTGTWQFMSTRLLTSPGSRHTITDDLESHFFVLMWAALHWVKHNQPGRIPMEHIFDQQWPSQNGSDIIMGGAGKVLMYGGTEFLCEVEFICKPFNELFWDLWMLFADYLEQRQRAKRKRHPEPLVLPEDMIVLFEAALEKPGWINDKVADQFPRTGGKNGSGMPLSGVDTGANYGNPNQGKKRGISKSLGVDLEQLPAKRMKGAQRSEVEDSNN